MSGRALAGLVLFALGLALFRRIHKIRVSDPIEAAQYERNPWWPYYTMRLFSLGMMAAAVVIMWRT